MREEEVFYERVMDYQATFGDGRGASVLEDLRRQYCERSSFAPGDPYKTTFQEGQRDVVLAIEAMLRTAGDKHFALETINDYFGASADVEAEGE